MSNCPGSDLENRIINLERLCMTYLTLTNATLDILKRHGIIDEKELKDKVDELYGNLELSLLEPLNKTVH